MERIRNGSVSVIGKVGSCDPPYLVLPLTIEPSKPRLCHDERYLNLWIQDNPFLLDTLKEVPRIVGKDAFLASLDDKSGYDHIFLNPASRKFFGIQFAGWYFVFNTIPFGFKASAYVYHSTGLVPVSYGRKLGVSCLLYIDDRMLGEWRAKFGDKNCMGILACLKSLYIVCQILIRLGYFLNLNKCVFELSRCLKFLGMFCDSEKLAFLLPNEKKLFFIKLRDNILSSETVSLKTLQRFAGKCISLLLAIPAARLFSREINRAISIASKNSREIVVYEELRNELLFWKFIDEWKGFSTWREEKHFQCVLATDSSSYKWGAFLLHPHGQQEFGDYWKSRDSRPIHIKEAQAVVNSLFALKETISDHRVDVFCDNLAVKLGQARELATQQWMRF